MTVKVPCEGIIETSFMIHCLTLFVTTVPVILYNRLGFFQPSSSEWIHKETCVCVCFLVFMFLEIVVVFVVTSSDFTGRRVCFDMKSLCDLQKAYTVPITHHIILEQSKCVCVRVCTRACCEHCFLIVSVSFRTQGSAVSYR